jgi:hypothetical protein
VHRLEYLLGDGLGLDERDEAELGVTLFTDDLKPLTRELPLLFAGLPARVEMH